MRKEKNKKGILNAFSKTIKGERYHSLRKLGWEGLEGVSDLEGWVQPSLQLPAKGMSFGGVSNVLF